MRIFITTFIFIQLILSSITLPQNEKSKIFDHPHERDETIWLSKFPHSLTPLKVPQHNPDFITDFLNIDISKNLFPQNEPSVKISRVNPYRVIAAWRDFRTGVNPPLRRVGYSLSSDGGETWSNSKLLPQIIPNAALSSDPVVGVDLSGNFYIFTISINDDTGNYTAYVTLRPTAKVKVPADIPATWIAERKGDSAACLRKVRAIAGQTSRRHLRGRPSCRLSRDSRPGRSEARNCCSRCGNLLLAR